MSEVLNKNLFLVKEHVGMFKAANNYDIFDPENGEKIMECREPSLGFFTKMLRFTDYKELCRIVPEFAPAVMNSWVGPEKQFC